MSREKYRQLKRVVLVAFLWLLSLWLLKHMEWMWHS